MNLDPAPSEAKMGWADLFAGREGVRSITLAGGVALHAVNVYIATTIMPSVVRDIGGLDYYAWNTTRFVVASITGSALSARLLGKAGPRGAYAIAATLFALGSFVCAAAPTMPVLLVGRVVQGFGGGFLFALSYAMIRVVFAEALWPRAMALVSGMWGVATLVGPAVGGVFAELDAWRAAFWSLIPVAALFMLLALAVLPKQTVGARTGVRTPALQLFFLTAAVIAVSAGSVASAFPWQLSGLVTALVLLGALIAKEKQAKHRLLPRGAFRLSAPLGAAYATMSLLAIAVTSSEIFVPLFLQVLHAQTPLYAGYLAALMAAGWTVGSIASAGLGERGAGRAMIAAPALSFVGMVALSVLVPRPSNGDWQMLTPIAAALAIVGVGVGLGWPHLLTRVFKVAPGDEQALASASITTVQLFAAAAGAALAGMVANLGGLSEPGGQVGTSGAAFWLFAVFGLAPLAALCTARTARFAQAGPKAHASTSTKRQT